MKILFDHQIFSKERYGGVARYYCELVKQLRTIEGVDADIFAPLYISEYLSASDNLHPSGMKISKPGKIEKYMVWGINTVVSSLVIGRKQNIDIYHETYYYGTGVYPKSAKRVITVFDMIHEKMDNVSKNQARACRNKAKAVNRADHIICISKNTQKDLMDILNVPEQKTSVVYLGYSLMSGTLSDRTTKYDRPYLLFVGQRGGYKNFDRLLHAYANSELLKHNYYLICFGGPAFNHHEMTLMKSYNLADSQVRHVSGNDEILSKLYSNASVFVYPSLYEGFGIPLLEAMAHDCPVACSNTSSLPEVAGEAAETFNPGDSQDMCKTIEKILTSSEVSAKLVKNGRERIKNYSWNKCARDTLDVYKKVLGGR